MQQGIANQDAGMKPAANPKTGNKASIDKIKKKAFDSCKKVSSKPVDKL